jgi:polyhydroxyalkanoate synthase
LASLKPFIGAMPTDDVRIIEYPGEVGVSLQHLGILIGREAQEQVWPEIASWVNSHVRRDSIPPVARRARPADA